LTATAKNISVRINLIQKQIDLINSWGYGDLNFDAIFKWANIIYEFHNHFGPNPNSLKILDLGGGLGPLDLYFTNFGQVTNIDLDHSKTWFATNDKGLLIDSVGPKFIGKRLTRISGDFFQKVNAMTNEYDFVYDSCSIIHFQRSIIGRKTHVNTLFGDKSLIRAAKELNFLTNSNSIVVMATDMAHPKSIAFKEIIFQERILNSFRLAGFKTQILIGEDDYSSTLKPIDRRRKGEKARSLNTIASNLSLEQLLSTRWPSKSLVNSKTIIGIFIFTKSIKVESCIPVGKWKNTKSSFLGMIYKVIDPLQRFIRGES